MHIMRESVRLRRHENRAPLFVVGKLTLFWKVSIKEKVEKVHILSETFIS